MNKKLLLINYYWPPSGGPAVQRWLSLTTELANLGWKIWVVTVDEKYATYQLYDDSLVDQIHPAVQVVKTKTIEPFGLFKLLFGKKSIPAPGFANEANPSLIKKATRFLRGNLFIPDPRKYWKKFAVKAAEKLIKDHAINLVITAGPPHSTHFIGKALKYKLGIKWVCDFHDLWTDVIYYDLLFHLPIVKKLDNKLQREILETCDHVITVGEKYKEKLLSKSTNIVPEKISLARIGYSAKLFKTETSENKNEFVIGYIGSIAEYYEPEIFFNAVQTIAKNNQKVKLLFAGVASPVIINLVHKYGLQSWFTNYGYVVHEKAVQLMHQCTVLLLINPVTKDEAMVIPGKIYEYLATGNPIINITRKDSETAKLIEICNAGKTFERNEAAALSDYLHQLYTLWQNNQMSSIMPNKLAIQQFSHTQIALDLQEVLQKEIL